jgi:hypothetical protein
MDHKACRTVYCRFVTRTSPECKIVEPFDEATEALSGEKYPTWSLTLPILRMIKIHLVEFKVSGYYSQSTWFEDARSTVEAFQKEILKEFCDKFSQNNISLLWAILLDPRLTGMNGFSLQECSFARKELFKQMESAPSSIKLLHCSEQIQSDGEMGFSNSSSLLSNIFHKQSNQNEESREKDEETSEIELDKYLSLCAQSTISEPLQWWKD